MIGHKSNTWRAYQAAQRLIQPKKKPSGTRKYTPEHIQIIQFIYHLIKEKGMTIKGAKKQLKLKVTNDPKQALLVKLELIKASLEQLKKKI